MEVEKEGHQLDHGKWCPDLDEDTFMYETVTDMMMRLVLFTVESEAD